MECHECKLTSIQPKLLLSFSIVHNALNDVVRIRNIDNKISIHIRCYLFWPLASLALRHKH